jgi:predicted  nucleic acid-binding Zn-ribbon protein
MMLEAHSAADKPPGQADMNGQVEALQEELRRANEQLEKSTADRAGADMRSEGEQDDLRTKNAKLSSELVEARQQVLETARLRAENDTLAQRLEVVQEQMKSLHMSKPNGYGSAAAASAESELVNSKDEAAAPRMKLSMPTKVVKENVLHETGQSRSPGTAGQDRRQDTKKKDTGKGATRFENTLFGSMKGKKK